MVIHFSVAEKLLRQTPKAMHRLALAFMLLQSAVAWATQVEVPADVGVGPAAYWYPIPLLENRGAVPHFALTLSIAAVIDQEFIANNRGRLPASYQQKAGRLVEARIGPSIFIPDTLTISPKVDALGGVGMYGVTWRPLGLNWLSVGQYDARTRTRSPVRLSLGSGLLVTAMVIYSDLPAVPLTFFLRPGIDLKLTLELQPAKSFVLSVGGGGFAYVPQVLGGFGFGSFDRMVCLGWFAFVKFHARFPYSVNL